MEVYSILFNFFLYGFLSEMNVHFCLSGELLVYLSSEATRDLGDLRKRMTLWPMRLKVAHLLTIFSSEVEVEPQKVHSR